MKKKLIAGILALSSVFCLASCDKISGLFGKNSSSSIQTPASDVAGAKAYLQDMYLKKNVEERFDYDVVKAVNIGGVVYTIAWTVACDVDGAVALVDGTDKVTVDLNENLDEDTPYVLTATITAPDKTTANVSFNRTVKAAPTMVSMPITEAPQEDVEYRLYAWQNTKKQDCYFAGDMSGFYYKTSSKYEDAAILKAEYVAGSTTEFNLYFEHKEDGKQYIGVQEGWNATNKHWTFNVVYASTAPSSFVWDAENQTITTTVPCRSAADNTNKDATEQPDTATLFLGCKGTYTTIQAETIDKIKTFNVAKLVGLKDRTTVEAPDKIAQTMKEVSLNPVIIEAATKTLPTMGTTFADVEISWAVESTNATVANGVLTTTAPAAATTATLTATFKCGETTDTETYTISIIPNETKAIIDAAYALQNSDSFENATSLTGIVTGFMKNGEWAEKYKNVSVYLAVYDGEKIRQIGAYQTPCLEADDIQVGDFLTVTGTITTYNGAPQFAKGCENTHATLTAQDLLPFEKAELSVPTTFTENKTITLPVAGKYSQDITFEWSSNNACAVVDGGNLTVTLGTQTQNVTLTCNVKANGQTLETLTYNFEVAAVTLVTTFVAPQENTAYYYYAVDSGKVYYFAGYTSGYYFQHTTNFDEAVPFFVEVKDATAGTFYLYYMKDGAKAYMNTYGSTTHVNNKTVANKDEATVYTYNATYNTIAVNINTADIPNTDYYLGYFSNSIRASKLSYAATSAVGHLATYVENSTITTEMKVAEEKYEFADKVGLGMVASNTVITLPVVGAKFDDVTIEWASDKACAVVAGDKLTVTQGDAKQTVTLTATFKVNGTVVGDAVTVTFEVAKQVTVTRITSATMVANTEYVVYYTVDGANYFFNGTLSSSKMKTTQNIDEAKKIKFVASATAGQYYIVYGDTYLGYSGSSTNFKTDTAANATTESTGLFLWVFDADGVKNVKSGRYIAWYASSTDFRPYSPSCVFAYIGQIA